MNQPGKIGAESDAVYPVQGGGKGTSRLGYGIEGEEKHRNLIFKGTASVTAAPF